jgi:hypothetical protein
MSVVMWMWLCRDRRGFSTHRPDWLDVLIREFDAVLVRGGLR